MESISLARVMLMFHLLVLLPTVLNTRVVQMVVNDLDFLIRGGKVFDD